MKIIHYPSGKRKLDLVAGLVWHPLQQLSGSGRKKETLEIAKSSGSDFMVKRGSDSPHIGFAKKSKGGRVGQVSVAAVIADHIKETYKSRNFLISLQVPEEDDLFVYVAVHDGVILADGDVCGSAMEIRARLSADSAYEAWEKIICPTDWGINNSEELTFADIFTSKTLNKRKRWTLNVISVSLSRVLLPLLLVVILTGGAYFGLKYKEKQDLLAQQAFAAAELQRLAAEALAAGRTPLQPSVPPPWLSQPPPAEFAQACSDARKKMNFNGGNWLFKSATCADGMLATAWTRPGEAAWISHLLAIQPQAMIAPDASGASVRIPVTFRAFGASNDAIPFYQRTYEHYIDQASRLGLSVRLSALVTPPAPVLLPNQKPATPTVLPPWWGNFSFAITTHLDPQQVLPLLSVPGMRVQKIVYSIKDGVEQFEISGEQYVKP